MSAAAGLLCAAAGLLCVADGGGEEARETRAHWRCDGFQYEPGALQ